MLGTTWFPADKNRVQKLIVQSGDVFWNPGGTDHEHCGDGYPKCRHVMELGRKYTGVDHTKKGKVVLTAPLPFSVEPQQVAAADKDQLQRALEKINHPDAEERAAGYITIGRIRGEVPAQTFLDAARDQNNQLLAFWAIERSDLDSKENVQKLIRFAEHEDPFIRQRACNFLRKNKVPLPDAKPVKSKFLHEIKFSTSFTPSAQYLLEKTIGDDPSTFFSGSKTPVPGDHITADLGRTFSVTRICIVDARPLGSGILPRERVGKVNISNVLKRRDLQYSLDGLEWHTLTPISYRCIDYRISPTNMRYIRLLVTASQAYWPAIFEFNVEA